MPLIDEDKLNEYAERVFDRCNYFNQYTLETIARRIKAIGELSAFDQETLKNMADISGDMKAITEELARITEMNVRDIEEIYIKTMTDGVNSYEPLYEYREMPFVPFKENDVAKGLVRHWAKETVGEMVNLSRTKALCFDKYNLNDEIIGSTPLEGAFQKAIDDAVVAVSSGTVDFNTAMKKTIENLGGSGVKVKYASGVNRSLSGMVRQNLLHGAKEAAQSYDEEVGKELGCDGFEVDYHSAPRDSHAFMGGEMFSYNGDVTINGKTYKDGKEALRRLKDYGCLHFKMDVILGVSEPRYNKKWLKEQKKKDKELIEFEGKSKTAYEWKQVQRRIETECKRQNGIANMAKAAGNKTLENNSREKVSFYRDKYDRLCDTVGLEKRYNRMAAYDKKPLTGGSSGGIIEVRGGKSMSAGGILDNGALNPNKESDFDRAQEHAIKYYDEIRHRKTDIKTIAKNTKWKEADIETVKKHIFINKYDLGGEEPENFFPHYDIAISWQNLIDGKKIEHKDITLLKHELYEYKLMTEQGINYREAHKMAEKKYNYSKAVEEWREKNE